ncbi:MAG TPA: DUF547 domain-containing protein [Rubrivivax sp.]|nr:DUF547 domain-containing protein [Rubrivivax sp.]
MKPLLEAGSMLRRRQLLLGSAAGLALVAAVQAQAQAQAQAQTFDHSHTAWTALLKRHVVLLRGGQASQLRYAGMQADRADLKAYLESLSALPPEAFDGFTKAQQQAFLINAYNAFTVELILTRYPALKSIKDLGGTFSSPWKGKWIQLLGGRLSLDDIEHAMLRRRGVYDDPRVHFAVNCASVGCPMLREEAFVAERLDAQLEQQGQRFMADRTRNRWNGQRQRLELSKIFDWYGEDFRLGHGGIASLAAFAARHADLLADAPADRDRIRSAAVEIVFLDYDWALNDTRGVER